MIGFFKKAISNNVVHSSVAYDKLLEIIGNIQAGHSSEVAIAHYARDANAATEVPEPVLKQQLMVSGPVLDLIILTALFRAVTCGTGA